MGALLAWTMAFALNLDLPLARAFIIVPLGIALAVLGGLLPAIKISAVPPAIVLRQGEVDAVRARYWSLPGLVGLAWHGMMRRRTRTMVVILSMALATGLFTVFLSATLGLRGYLEGTLLGEYLILRVESHHYVMAAVSLVVAGIAIAEVLLVSAIERRREIGILKALGWRSREVLRLFILEGVTFGLVGGVVGVFLAALSMLIIFEGNIGSWALVLPIGIMTPVVSGLAAGVLPGYLASRIPPAAALRYE